MREVKEDSSDCLSSLNTHHIPFHCLWERRDSKFRDIANGSLKLPGSVTSAFPVKLATSGYRSVYNCLSFIVHVHTTLVQAFLLTELLGCVGQCPPCLSTLSNVRRLFLKTLYKASWRSLNLLLILVSLTPTHTHLLLQAGYSLCPKICQVPSHFHSCYVPLLALTSLE